MLVIFAALWTVSFAIIYREDVDVSNYRSSAAAYPSAFPYQNIAGDEGYSCAGTMIGKRHAITAAHCFSGNQAAFTVTVNGSTYTVAQTRVHNCWTGDGPNSADLAILVFSSDVTSVGTFPTVYNGSDDEEEKGEEIVVVGWGSYGPVGQDLDEDEYNDLAGVFHRGYNVVTDVKNGMVVYEMDKDKLALEAIATSGDSGGPAYLVQSGVTYLVGVNSYGDCATPAKCDYGAKDYYVRVGGAAYEWIVANVADSSTTGGVDASSCSDYPEDDDFASSLAVLAALLLTAF